MSKNNIMLVKTMCDSKSGAREIADTLIKDRLVACANIISPCESVFRWKGKIETEQEYLLIMKTQARHLPTLTRKIIDLHSYELPEVSAIPVTDGSPDYLQWVAEETNP